MPRVSHSPKVESFNFRIDADLKVAFTQAVEADDKPAAQVLREFMRAYVERQKRKTFALEARRQALLISERARDQSTDESASLRELEALLDADLFGDEWTA